MSITIYNFIKLVGGEIEISNANSENKVETYFCPLSYLLNSPPLYICMFLRKMGRFYEL